MRQNKKGDDLFVGAYEGLGIIEILELSCEKWTSALKEGTEAAIVALLLLSLPNLNEVNIMIGSPRPLFLLLACDHCGMFAAKKTSSPPTREGSDNESREV